MSGLTPDPVDMNPNEVDLGASSRNGLMMYMIDGGEQT